MRGQAAQWLCGVRARPLLLAALTAACGAAATWAFPLHASLVAMVAALGALSFRLLRAPSAPPRAQPAPDERDRMAAALERAREAERTRIARELHDELGQQLTALSLALGLTQRRCDGDPERIRANLDELAALLARTHATVRRLVSELRPLPLEQLGLAGAVEWLARQTERHAGVRCRVEVAALDALPPAAGAALFRVVQEALTNVARHAHAREVEVRAALADGLLVLSICDDGIGLPRAPAPSGFGLVGMRERVATLGGRLELAARPGGGTRLAVMLPLGHVAAAACASR